MSGITFIAAVLVSIALGALAMRYILHNKKSAEDIAAKIRLDLAEEQRLAQEKTNRELEEKILGLERANAELSSTLAHERQAATEKLKLVEDAKQQMSNAFKVIGQEALDANRESFLALATERLAQFQTGAKTDLEKREQAIRELVAPVAQSLEKMDGKIAALEKAREGAYGELREQLKSMKEDQGRLRGETAALVQALRSPNKRGQWGELQLKRTLEMAGMVEGIHYTQQKSMDGDEGRLRPDVIINLPGGQSIIIDSKVPIDAYLDALREDVTENERRDAMTRHALQVRERMKELGSKSYWSQLDTPEFVVMFLPGESYFSAALENDPGLIEFGVDHKVLPASPTTLISLLRAVSYGWRQEKLAENAREISELGQELYKRLCAFGEHMQKIGKGLETAMNSYNSAVGSLERSVLPGARKFQELHAAPKDKDLPAPEQLDHTPRQLTAPEFEIPGAENPQRKTKTG